MELPPQSESFCAFCDKNSERLPSEIPTRALRPTCFCVLPPPFAHAHPMLLLRLPAFRSALLACATALAPLPAKTLIHVGSLIDGRADTPQKSVTLTVDGERITAVTPGYIAPAAGDTVIDLQKRHRHSRLDRLPRPPHERAVARPLH